MCFCWFLAVLVGLSYCPSVLPDVLSRSKSKFFFFFTIEDTNGNGQSQADETVDNDRLASGAYTKTYFFFFWKEVKVVHFHTYIQKEVYIILIIRLFISR